ncbi:hypothetical protein Tco_1149531 [Tanacetum coccineum]
METSIADQIALDDALVAPANRLKISKCNLRLSSDVTSKEATLQVVFDVLKHTPFYKAFQVSADVPHIYMQEFWATASVHNRSIRLKMNNKKHIVNLDYFREMLQIFPKISNQKFEEPPLEKEILAFLASLGHSGEIRKITDINVNNLRLSQAQILWDMYHNKNVDYASLLWEDFTFQVENKNLKKGNAMYYPRFTKLIFNFFMTKDSSIPRRNKINWHYARDDPMFTTINVISRHEDTQLYGAILPRELTNEDIQNSESYKEYYAIASGVVPPKTKASAQKKKADSDVTTKKKSSREPKAKTIKQTGKMTGSEMQIQPTTRLETLSKIALTEAEQLQIAIKRSRIQTHISQASGSGDGVDILSKVPDEQAQEKTGTDEGAGDIPEVPDVPKHHSESKEESWTFSESDDDKKDEDGDKKDDDDDDKESDGADSKATEFDNADDNLTHPKLSTFTTDDQEVENVEEEKTDDDDEELSDQLVSTPSDQQYSDESENQEDDDMEQDSKKIHDDEEMLYGNLNINLDRSDIDMNADTTEDAEDAHVTLTAAIPIDQQQSLSVSDLVSKFINPSQDEGIESVLMQDTMGMSITVSETPLPTVPITQTTQLIPPSTTTTTTLQPEIPTFASVFKFDQRVSALESDMTSLKNSNPFSETVSSIPGIVNAYLGSKVKETVDAAIQLKADKLREEAQTEN